MFCVNAIVYVEVISLQINDQNDERQISRSLKKCSLIKPTVYRMQLQLIVSAHTRISSQSIPTKVHRP